MKLLVALFALSLGATAQAAEGSVELVTETRENLQKSSHGSDPYITTTVHFATGLLLKSVGSSETDCKQLYDEYVQKLELKNEIILKTRPCVEQADKTWAGSVLLPKL